MLHFIFDTTVNPLCKDNDKNLLYVGGDHDFWHHVC